MTQNASTALRVARTRPETTLPALTIRHRPACYEYRLARRPVGGRAKRAFDFAAAAVALVVLSPLLIAVAILVRLDSPGPSLFRQRRTGFKGRSFRIYKFRTMTQLDDGARIAQARPADPRVTRIGHWLRRYSIDELPQLLNVLRGHMSLVGPRPHAMAHDSVFFAVDDGYPRRFLARPGITGEAQVAGARGRTDTPEKIQDRLRLDLRYVDNWSLWRDLRIIVATVWVLVTARNAC